MQKKKIKDIFARLQVGQPAEQDANHIIKIHHIIYRNNKILGGGIENYKKTMWLFSKRREVDDKNRDKLIETSENNNVDLHTLHTLWRG